MMRISSDVEIIVMWSTGKAMKLSPAAEEVATFYAKMLDHEYTTKDIFRKNFFKDWRKVTRSSTHYFLSTFKGIVLSAAANAQKFNCSYRNIVSQMFLVRK